MNVAAESVTSSEKLQNFFNSWKEKVDRDRRITGGPNQHDLALFWLKPRKEDGTRHMFSFDIKIGSETVSMPCRVTWVDAYGYEKTVQTCVYAECTIGNEVYYVYLSYSFKMRMGFFKKLSRRPPCVLMA